VPEISDLRGEDTKAFGFWLLAARSQKPKANDQKQKKREANRNVFLAPPLSY
jgi:hypothetical protein